MVLAVVVSVPWTKQRWALPFLCVLATTPAVSAKLGIRHKPWACGHDRSSACSDGGCQEYP